MWAQKAGSFFTKFAFNSVIYLFFLNQRGKYVEAIEIKKKKKGGEIGKEIWRQ